MPRKYDQDRKQFMKVPQSWRDDEDDKPKRGGLYFGGRYLLGANTPREFGRRLGCCLAVVTILCQLLRIYLKHEIERKRLANEAWLATAKQMHFENHTCHTRHSSLVEGCSPIKCERLISLSLALALSLSLSNSLSPSLPPSICLSLSLFLFLSLSYLSSRSLFRHRNTRTQAKHPPTIERNPLCEHVLITIQTCRCTCGHRQIYHQGRMWDYNLLS